MTKQESIDAMYRGKKVTHRWFSDDEWMTIENGKMLFEDGVRCPPHEFWSYRTDSSWQTDYSLFNHSPK